MKEIKQGEKLRFGYGYCWRNYDRDTTTTCLVPFNILLIWLRKLYFYLYSPARNKNDEEIKDKIHEAYRSGLKEGKIETELFYRKEIANYFKDITKTNVTPSHHK